MRFILFFVVLLVPSFSFAQEFVKCGVALVNWKPLDKRIVLSDNEKYMAKMDWSKGARVYELEGDDYKYRKLIKLEESLPQHLFITNKGDLIVYGEGRLFGTGQAQSDNVYIYMNLGETLKIIDAEMVLSKKEIKESIIKYEKSDFCTPVKPWICHSEEPNVLYGENLVIYDTLNRPVKINLDTFNIDVGEPFGSCDLFN